MHASLKKEKKKKKRKKKKPDWFIQTVDTNRIH